MPKKSSKKHKKLKGFTVPELLAIIAVVGILAIIAFTAFAPSKARTRDSKRITEINHLRTALQLYHMDNGRYPDSIPPEEWCSLEDSCANVLAELSPYLPSTPTDPLFGKGQEPDENTIYSYQYISTSSGEGYKLYTALEKTPPFYYELGSFLGAPIAYVPGGGGGAGPIANNDDFSSCLDSLNQMNVLENDEEGSYEIDPNTLTIQNQPLNGTVDVVSGKVDYTPDGGFLGEDEFTYTVDDVEGNISNEATVVVSVLETWGTIEVISEGSTGVSSWPSIGVDSANTIHIVWEERTDNYLGSGSDYDIFYRYKPEGGDWSAIELVSTESTGNSSVPSIAIDSFDVIHVVWRDFTNYLGSGTDADIFYKSRIPGSGWTLTEVVSTESTGNSGEGYGSSLIIDNANVLHVAWRDQTNYLGSGTDADIFYKSRIPGSGWTLTEVVNMESNINSSHPSLVIENNGVIHIVWQEGYDEIFYKKRLTDGTWTSQQLISTESTDQTYHPVLVLNSQNTLHTAWNDYTPPETGVASIYYKYKTASGDWTTTEVVSTESSSYSWDPKIGVDSNDTIHVAWTDWTAGYSGAGPDWDVFYKYKPDGGDWTLTEVVNTDGPIETWGDVLSLTVDNRDMIHIVWRDNADYLGSGPDHDIFYVYRCVASF